MVCYFYGCTPQQFMGFTFPQIDALVSNLSGLLERDPRRAGS